MFLLDVLCDANSGGKIFFQKSKRDQNGHYIDGNDLNKALILKHGSSKHIVEELFFGTEKDCSSMRERCESIRKNEHDAVFYVRKKDKIETKTEVLLDNSNGGELSINGLRNIPTILTEDGRQSLVPRVIYGLLSKINIKRPSEEFAEGLIHTIRSPSMRGDIKVDVTDPISGKGYTFSVPYQEMIPGKKLYSLNVPTFPNAKVVVTIQYGKSVDNMPTRLVCSMKDLGWKKVGEEFSCSCTLQNVPAVPSNVAGTCGNRPFFSRSFRIYQHGAATQ
jgi:hypothetical protein